MNYKEKIIKKYNLKESQYEYELKRSKKKNIRIDKWLKNKFCNLVYGCEIENDLNKHFDEHFIKWLKKIGIKEVIKLNNRKRGLTSSGRVNDCHINVFQLVSTFGGRHKHGFLIRGHRDINCGLIYHSAWLTPEKKLVNVTMFEHEEDYCHGHEKDWDYFCLFDTDFNETKRAHDISYQRFITHNYEVILNKIVDNDPTTKDLKFTDVYFSHYKELFYTTNVFKHWLDKGKELLDIQINYRHQWNKKYKGAFSKKSLLTKKSWEEIVEDEKYQSMRISYEVCCPQNEYQRKEIFNLRDEQTFKFKEVA